MACEVDAELGGVAVEVVAKHGGAVDKEYAELASAVDDVRAEPYGATAAYEVGAELGSLSLAGEVIAKHGVLSMGTVDGRAVGARE